MRSLTALVVVSICTLAVVVANNPKQELMLLQQTFIAMAKKLRAEIDRFNRMKIPIAKRNLVVFHVNEVTQEKDSVDISYNNLQIFLSALSQHSKDANQHAFYIFNIAGGYASNFAKYLPIHKSNVAHVEWPKKCGEKETPLKTVLQLGQHYYGNFSSVIITSDRSRGPMVGVKDGEWIEEFRYLLDRNHVGVVGSSFSCEVFAHAQPHMYAVRTELLTDAVARYNVQKKTMQSLNLMQYFQDGASVVATRLGYKLASVLYHKRAQQEFFSNQCLTTTNPNSISPASSNPLSWCDLLPDEVIFVKWGGVPLRPPATMCPEHINRVLERTAQLAVEDPNLQLHIPETFHRGITYELMRQYNMEQWRGRDISQLIISNNGTATQRGGRNKRPTSGKEIHYATALANPKVHQEESYSAQSPKVCLLVSVQPKHDSHIAVRGGSIFTSIDIEGMLRSLLRQTNPNWKVFLLMAQSDRKFEGRVRNILEQYGDLRVTLLNGYAPATAQAAQLDRLIHELDNHEECVYASVTSADTVYGSEVVHNLLRTATASAAGGKGKKGQDKATDLLDASGAEGTTGQVPQIVLVPYDSRTTAEHEASTRNALRHIGDSWLEQCINFEAMFAAHLMPYTVQPNVMIGRVDLAAVFLHRESLLADKIQFGGLAVPDSIHREDHCAGCESAFYVQYLLRVKQWSSLRLPIDGLKSVVFRSPSPTLCVASGSVWFDYPDPQKTGCISQEVLRRLQSKDSKERPAFDWKFTYSKYKTCVRLSEHGYSNKDDIFFT